MKNMKDYYNKFVPAVQRYRSLPAEVQKRFPEGFLGWLYQIFDNERPECEGWCSGYPFTLCGDDSVDLRYRCDGECSSAEDRYLKRFGIPFALVEWVTYGGEKPAFE